MLSLVLPLLLVAGKAPAAKPEQLDALDFDNGTLLVSQSGSYGTGLSSWSAWRLTDGDPSLGWCSAQNEPTGGAFEWDLDTTWKLDTLVVSTEQVEEDSYPGISVKSVDLFVSDGGDYKKLGSFTLATKSSKKAFPLKGVTAKKVKLVVTGNHGHAEYTEIGELDLLGARVGELPKADLTGVFASSYGPMRFVQEGTAVYGCYDWASTASAIWGDVQGRVARVTWYEDSGESAREGTATFAVLPDQSFWGVWYEHGELAGEWAGPRSDEPPKCQPQKKGTVARLLKKNGRAVLYGIHFATGADVPLPESNATLDELAAALKQQAGVKVLIEGHTDSTNTDAFNLDLSQRRAKSVVEWLTKHGIDAGRLTAKGFGKAKPVADNATAQGRALNRRVEVSVVK
jgi:outer membrane protein OmpA-like peptidoglycan-associated protein